MKRYPVFSWFLFSFLICAVAQAQKISTDNLDQIVALKTLDQDAWDIVIRPDGRRVAFVGWRKPVQIFGSNVDMPFQKIDREDIVEFDFSPDPNIVAYCRFMGKGVTIANLKTKTETLLATSGSQIYLRFSPDGKILATGTYGTAAKLWNVETGKLIRELDMGPTEGALRPAFSPDGKVVVIGHRNANPRLFEVATGKLLHVLDKSMSQRMAFHPKRNILAIAFTDGTVGIWDVKSGKQLHDLQTDAEEVFTLCWSPDGSLLATAGLHGSVTLWSAKDLKELKKLEIAAPRVFALSFSPNGEMLIAGGNVVDGSFDRKVWRWKIKKSR